MFLLPLSGSLKKIKFGEFEAEIQPEEVKKIETEVREIPKTDDSLPYEINDTIDGIYSALENDHVLALAKLRIELEKVVDNIIASQDEKPRRKSLFTAIHFLEGRGLIDNKIIPPLKDVVAICNRALHGEDVTKTTAESIVNIGIDLLKKLHKHFYDLISKPTESEEISPRERDEYANAKYQVTTVVPLVEGPYTNRYIFNQEQLDQFLENYDEFAEFLITINKIKD